MNLEWIGTDSETLWIWSLIPASLNSRKIHWVQLYTELGDQIGFTLGFSMKNKLLAKLRTSSQWSYRMSPQCS